MYNAQLHVGEAKAGHGSESGARGRGGVPTVSRRPQEIKHVVMCNRILGSTSWARPAVGHAVQVRQ